jgi:hypothetical protein
MWAAARHGGGTSAIGQPALGELGRGALERRSALGDIGEVGSTACLVSALDDVTEVLYVGPPGWGLCVSHVVLTLFPWRPTG